MPGTGVRRMEWQSIEEFSAINDTLSYRFHVIHSGGLCHCIQANTYICRMDLNVSCELWVTIMLQWPFTDQDKCTFTLVGMLATMDTCVDRRCMGNLFTFDL